MPRGSSGTAVALLTSSDRLQSCGRALMRSRILGYKLPAAAPGPRKCTGRSAGCCRSNCKGSRVVGRCRNLAPAGQDPCLTPSQRTSGPITTSPVRWQSSLQPKNLPFARLRQREPLPTLATAQFRASRRTPLCPVRQKAPRCELARHGLPCRATQPPPQSGRGRKPRQRRTSPPEPHRKVGRSYSMRLLLPGREQRPWEAAPANGKPLRGERHRPRTAAQAQRE